jgi:hypothetical protein
VLHKKLEWKYRKFSKNSDRESLESGYMGEHSEMGEQYLIDLGDIGCEDGK